MRTQEILKRDIHRYISQISNKAVNGFGKHSDEGLSKDLFNALLELLGFQTITATNTEFTPVVGITSINVQDAIEEVLAAIGGGSVRHTDYVFASTQNYAAGNYTVNPASDGPFAAAMGYQNLSGGTIAYWAFRMFSCSAVSAGTVTVKIFHNSISAASGIGAPRVYGAGTEVDYLPIVFSGASALAYYKGNADVSTFGTIPGGGMIFCDLEVTGGVTITGGLSVNVNTEY